MHLQNININQWAFEFEQEHMPYISQEKVVTKPIPKINEGVLNDRGIFRAYLWMKAVHYYDNMNDISLFLVLLSRAKPVTEKHRDEGVVCGLTPRNYYGNDKGVWKRWRHITCIIWMHNKRHCGCLCTLVINLQRRVKMWWLTCSSTQNSRCLQVVTLLEVLINNGSTKAAFSKRLFDVDMCIGAVIWQSIQNNLMKLEKNTKKVILVLLKGPLE